MEPAERRSLGTLEALHEARLPAYPVVRCATWQPESGYRGAREIIETYGDRVTAIACANDEIALGAIRALHDLGLRVPEDVSIIGFDDNPISAYSSPSLTTMHQDFESLGVLAFDVLMDLIDGTASRTERSLPSQLIVRESTAAPHPHRGP